MKSLRQSKQKDIFEELTNKRMEEVQGLSKQIDLNNLNYQYNGKFAPKKFLAFKVPIVLYKNIKEGYITLEKTEEFKSEINKIVKGMNKLEEQNTEINNIKAFYE